MSSLTFFLLHKCKVYYTLYTCRTQHQQSQRGQEWDWSSRRQRCRGGRPSSTKTKINMLRQVLGCAASRRREAALWSSLWSVLTNTLAIDPPRTCRDSNPWSETTSRETNPQGPHCPRLCPGGRAGHHLGLHAGQQQVRHLLYHASMLAMSCMINLH